MGKLSLNRAKWPFIAFLASAAMLATAHAIERFLFLAPCPLCYNQRQIYWAAGALALIAIALNWRGAPMRLMSTMSVLLGVLFLAGAGIAGYHSLVEWGVLPAPDTCAATGRLDVNGDLWTRLGERQAIPSCDKVQPPFPILGLSMAGWNFIASITLAGASFFAATRPMRTDTANEPVMPATSHEHV
jgi:disulfide bond formation protein DsbB